MTTPNWNGVRVAVVGLARSGVSACHFLRKRGAMVTGTDRRTADQLDTVARDLQSAGVTLSLGAYPNLSEFEALVLSPGVDPAQEPIARARENGVRIVAELELGANEAKGRIVCITGTKGKSTTTMSLHAMLREAGVDARAVGNIGEPITAHVDGSDDKTVFVVEASSFQLEMTEAFHPNYAVFLNLFPDHLDRHPSFESYACAKARIFANQAPQDTAIINGDEPKVVEIARQTRANVIPFYPRTAPEDGRTASYFDGPGAVIRAETKTLLFSRADVMIPGAAVQTNLLAAATAAHEIGAPAAAIQNAVRNFRGVAHTFERLGEIHGVVFFNDSKATTLESVAVALTSFDAPVLAIMGGRLKTGSFRTLREAVSARTRAIYAIGESRGLIREALSDICPVYESDTLEEAVRSAYAAAKPGETVLLSPGCASFDMFRDYAHRGDTFRRAFHDLSLEGAA
ncbi:MAG: UDP-N-acetylmuramoyl-L-alanine--D-glutamate ligase [Vicinamibacteria bacterium]